MSFGFGVGDCICCIKLAHKVWKNCRDAPEDFRAVSTEVASLELVLKDVTDAVEDRELSHEKHNNLNKLVGGCSDVLTELQGVLDNYKSLGTQSKRTWDRMKWGSVQIEAIRLRLVSNTGLLTTFNVGLLGDGQARIEGLLRQLVMEHQAGLREGSVISSRAMDSIEDGDENVWSQIGRELEDLGITSNMIKEHRTFITNWIKQALQNGEFEEKEPPTREAASLPSSRRHSQTSGFSSGEHWYDENSRRLSVSSDPELQSARSPALAPLLPALVQLVECGTKAVAQLNECQSSIKGVPKSLRDVTIEVPLLLHTFAQTKKIAEAGQFDEATQLVLLPLVQGCHSQVALLNDTLIKILPQGDLSWRRGFKALFNLQNEKKIQQIIELLRKYERMMTMKHSSLVPDKEAEPTEAIDRRPVERPPFQTQTSNLPEHVEDPIRRLIMAELTEFKREQRERPDRRLLEQDSSDSSTPWSDARLNTSSLSSESKKFMTLEPGSWYRLANQVHGCALDVVNDGADCRIGTIEMATVQDVSGQYWQLQSEPNGFCSLSTLFLGPKRRLDVWGNDKTSPHLADAGHFSGQYWNIEQSGGSNRFKLTNTYSGPSLFLDTRSVSNQLYLSDGDRETQYWTFTFIRRVAPDELPS